MNKNKININGIKFDNIHELLLYMYKNNYDKNIINETKKIKNNHIKYIILYDDMFVIYFKSGCLEFETYYMELML